MKPSRLSWILTVVVALPAAGATATRVRVENTSDPSSRVTIGFADATRNAARLDVGDDGVAELVVEAPSPKLRLRGGTLQTDPMLDLIARRRLREESTAPALHVVKSVDAPVVFAPHGGPLVYDDWGGRWGSGSGTVAGWYTPMRQGSRESSDPRWRNGGDRERRHSPWTPTASRSFSARGVMPRVSRY